jgi:hypothetical protein
LIAALKRLFSGQGLMVVARFVVRALLTLMGWSFSFIWRLIAEKTNGRS